MTLAEFRFIYIWIGPIFHSNPARSLDWPEWVDTARLMLRVDGRRPRRGGRGL